jgi:hypothetical protein
MMDTTVFACLQSAVRIARDQQIQKVATLRMRLSGQYDAQTIDAALKLWANYEKEKRERYE